MPTSADHTPEISVIIPAYKARKFLPECLASIGDQTLLPQQILVIDDASPEPVDDIVANFAARPGFPPIRLIRHEVNRGQAAGRNTGIRASDSEWLAFIDSDDVWLPDHLEQAMATLDATGADLAFCPATIFENDIHENTPFIERPMTSEEISLAPFALLKRCFIIMSSVVARATAIREIGGFDEEERMRAVEDLDCFMKLLKNDAMFAISEKSTLFYRKHPAGATSRPGYMSYQSAYVRQIHIANVKGPWFEKRALVARNWWAAFNTLAITDRIRPDVLLKALLASLPVPWEIGRGVIRLLRLVSKQANHRRSSQ
jgi:glycosyltransferase involved in cell wall biosynthesis